MPRRKTATPYGRGVDRPTTLGEIAAANFVQLLQQFQAQDARGWGWKSRAAKHFCVSDTLVSNLLSGKTTRIGAAVIERVCSAAGISTTSLTSASRRRPH